jgi:hypothetical protein
MGLKIDLLQDCNYVATGSAPNPVLGAVVVDANFTSIGSPAFSSALIVTRLASLLLSPSLSLIAYFMSATSSRFGLGYGLSGASADVLAAGTAAWSSPDIAPMIAPQGQVAQERPLRGGTSRPLPIVVQTSDQSTDSPTKRQSSWETYSSRPVSCSLDLVPAEIGRFPSVTGVRTG